MKNFDQNTLNGHELKAIRQVLDGPEDELYALYWIWRRRENGAFTYDQALDVPLSQVMDEMGLDNPLAKKK